MTNMFDSGYFRSMRGSPAYEKFPSQEKTLLQILLEALTEENYVSERKLFTVVKRDEEAIRNTIDKLMLRYNLARKETRDTEVVYSLTNEGRSLIGVPIK